MMKPEYQNFFDEVGATAIDLPVAVQNELAAMVQRTYSSQTLGVPQSQIPSLPFQHPLLDQHLPGVNTIGGVEDALQRSVIPQVLGMTQRVMDNRGSVDPTSIFSDLYFGTIDAARTYQPTRNNKPVTFAHYATRQAFQAGSSAHRKAFSGLSIDQFTGDDGDLMPGAPSGLTVNDVQLDTMLDDIAGVRTFTPSAPVAPFETPSKRWFDPLGKVNASVPSPFYAPAGQGFLTNGQINPNLTTRPKLVNNEASPLHGTPLNGLQQVSVTPDEMRQLTSQIAADKTFMKNQPRPVQSFLRQTAEGLRGGGFISTDAEMIGQVAELDDVLEQNRQERTGALRTGYTDADIPRIKDRYGDDYNAIGDLPQNGPEDIARTVEGLRATNPAAIQSGEQVAEGRMAGVRLQSTAEYNRGKDAAARAAKVAEYQQAAKMDVGHVVSPAQSGRTVAKLDRVPTLEEAVSAVKSAVFPKSTPVFDNGTTAVPEPEAPPMTGRTVKQNAYSEAPASPEEPPMDPSWSEAPVSGVGNSAASWEDFVMSNSKSPSQLQSLTGSGGSQPPSGPPSEPPVAASPEEPDPNQVFNQPVEPAKSQKARASRSSKRSTMAPSQTQLDHARQKAAEAQRWIKSNAPEYEGRFLGQSGRSGEFSEFQNADPNFREQFKSILDDQEISRRAGVPSLLEGWSQQNNARRTGAASAPTAAASTAGATASSNGSRGGGNATTSTPVEDDDFWNRDPDLGTPRSTQQLMAEGQREFAGRAAQRVESDAFGQTERSGAQINDAFNVNNVPMSTRLASARQLMSNIGTEFMVGRRHEQYGEFEGSEFFNSKLEKTTIGRGMVGQAQRTYGAAVESAFEQGGFEGLSNSEVASTIHKRVGQFIGKSLDQYEKELENSGVDSVSANQARQKVGAVAKMYGQEGDKTLSNLLGTNPKDGDYSSVRATSDRDFASAMKNPAFADRVKALGGEEAVRNGSSRVIEADGQAYEVGGDGSGGPGSRRGRGIKSIYSEPLGHFMMAQFMASMAWKSTGGSVMDSANQWATNQYGFLGMEQYGDGEASAATLSRSRQELAANFSGRLAYEQYGAFSELGYAASNLPGRAGENIVRGVNDVKMGLGAAAVAGVGTWGLGALFQSTALTAAAGPVGIAAGAAIGVPSLVATAFNAAAGQDSYEGYSPKNFLSGVAMQFAQAGADRSQITGKTDFVSRMLSPMLFGATGEQQEHFAGLFGQSRRDFLANSWVADKIGIANVNWLTQGSDEKSQDVRNLSHSVMEDTGLTEDVTLKQLTGLQLAFGGLDTKERRDAASSIMKAASDQGVEASAILAGASNLAGHRGIYEGTAEYMELATGFAGLNPVEQQKELLKSSRNYQKYAQWVPYLEGGNAEGYSLFNQLGGEVNMAQTQSIQQVFAQAQQAGVNLTPAMSTSLAATANQLKPWQAMDVTRMASSMNEMGASSFTGAFTDLSQALQTQSFGFDGSNIVSDTGNRTDTLNFIKGVTSGNQYALSDYGRMAGIGVLQSVDQQGLQTGLKDMSGFLAYAQQNVLGGGLLGGMQAQQLTGAQTLSGLGMQFANTSQSALLGGGIWGYQQSMVDQTNALQSQSMGLQFQQLASNRSFMNQSWGIENQTNAAQWQQTLAGFSFQGLMMDTQREHRLEDAALQREQRGLSNESNTWNRDFDYQTSLMRREYAREDYQYNTQMRQLSFGWNMEDMDEQIRRSSGYERSLLIKQRDRATLSENLQSGQAETQFERQEEMWAREDERYAKGVEFNEQMINLDNERFELNQRQAEEMYVLNKDHLAEELESATHLHDLRMEMEALQRERQEEQLRHSEQSLNIQKQMMDMQNEYANNMTIISHTQTEMEASLRKITSYSPAFSRMLGDFLDFLEGASQLPPPGYGGSVSR
jgi:hypothetical protein